VAYRMGYINGMQLENIIGKLPKNDYSNYLKMVLGESKTNIG